MATLSGFAWLDENLDGIRGQIEPGVPEIVVELYGLGEADGQLIKRIETDFNGSYQFANLTAGEYYLSFRPLASEFSLVNREGYLKDGKRVDSIANSLDGKSVVLTLKTRDNLTNQNVGIVIDSYDKVLGATVETSTEGRPETITNQTPPSLLMAQSQAVGTLGVPNAYERFTNEKTSVSVWALILILFSLAALVHLLIFLKDGGARKVFKRQLKAG